VTSVTLDSIGGSRAASTVVRCAPALNTLAAGTGITIRKARKQERGKAPDSKGEASEKARASSVHASNGEEFFSFPTSLTALEKMKTGPSRFRPDFSSVTVDDRHHGPHYSEDRMAGLQGAYTRFTTSLHGAHAQPQVPRIGPSPDLNSLQFAADLAECRNISLFKTNSSKPAANGPPDALARAML
jgi:hypothetical protein